MAGRVNWVTILFPRKGHSFSLRTSSVLNSPAYQFWTWNTIVHLAERWPLVRWTLRLSFVVLVVPIYWRQCHRRRWWSMRPMPIGSSAGSLLLCIHHSRVDNRSRWYVAFLTRKEKRPRNYCPRWPSRDDDWCSVSNDRAESLRCRMPSHTKPGRTKSSWEEKPPWSELRRRPISRRSNSNTNRHRFDSRRLVDSEWGNRLGRIYRPVDPAAREFST